VYEFLESKQPGDVDIPEVQDIKRIIRESEAVAGIEVMGLTRALALEGAPHGVTVNCLCPGPFETPMNRVLMNDPVAYQAFLAKLPIGRWGQPEELGPAIVYLCSEASAFMTGTSLTIDGGWTAQ